MNHRRLSSEEEVAATAIVEAAFRVHSKLGPGLLESIYEVCLCHELEKQGFTASRQVCVPLVYDGLKFEESFRLDLLVDGRVVCELKAAEKHNPLWEAQLLSYMKLAKKHLGFLINFNVPLIKHGIKRMII